MKQSRTSRRTLSTVPDKRWHRASVSKLPQCIKQLPHIYIKQNLDNLVLLFEQFFDKR